MNNNFFSWLETTKAQKNDKIVEDKSPKTKASDCYTIFCTDSEGTIPRLINAIGKHGNGGHSFDIVVDADTKEAESFFWDGDGSDRIEGIIATPEKKDNPIVRMCLQTLQSIEWQAKEAAETEERYGEPPPTEAERIQILNDIIHDSKLLLNGCCFKDHHQQSLETIREFIKNALQGYTTNSDPVTRETLVEDLEHIKKIAEEGLEQGITFRA